jgi:DNA-binding response OmpR family regulator
VLRVVDGEARWRRPSAITDVIILDDDAGLTVSVLAPRPIRASDHPVIVTARGQERDILSGLQGGAADYVVKPFSLKELLARVDVALRRA